MNFLESNGMGQKQLMTTDIRKQFTAAGFEIVESGVSPGSIGVKKYNCLNTWN